VTCDYEVENPPANATEILQGNSKAEVGMPLLTEVAAIINSEVNDPNLEVLEVLDINTVVQGSQPSSTVAAIKLPSFTTYAFVEVNAPTADAHSASANNWMLMTLTVVGLRIVGALER